MKIFIKIIFRLSRILTLKKGVYGKVGKENKFCKGVHTTEGSSVGSYNYFGPRVMVNNATIGNYCSIGPDVKLGQAEHSKDFITTSQLISKELIGHSLNKNQAKVGNDVWLGANVVVLQGISIENGVIVGANAVVTKNLPPYSIAVGVPARVIGYRFKQEKINKIQKSNWYNHDLSEAKEIIKNIIGDNV